MGTRGTYGLRIKGKDYLMYNHFDSYPSVLGKKIIDYIKSHEFDDTFRSKVAKLKLVNAEDFPTNAQRKKLEKYSDYSVSNGKDWYSILRKCQGNLDLTIESGYMINDNEFILDSLFCEWGYIINLDSNKLEVYRGFQSEPHNLGRYSQFKKSDDYYSCALIAEIDFNELIDGFDLDKYLGSLQTASV